MTTATILSELILAWAKERNEPFMTMDVYNDIEETESSTHASQAIGMLFKRGLLARKKVDGLRFSYALPRYALEGYETEAGVKPAAESTVSREPEPVAEQSASYLGDVSDRPIKFESKKMPEINKNNEIKPENKYIDNSKKPYPMTEGDPINLGRGFTLRIEINGDCASVTLQRQ